MHRGEPPGAAPALCAAALALAAGCGAGGSDGVTYYKDVLPIVVKRCGGCHAPGELAPFSLMSYEEARLYAAPTGISLAAGTKIIIQVHYNLLARRDFLDRTTADLHYADSPVTKPALVRPLGNTTFVVPPGVASQTVAAELPVMMPGALRGVVPHMHLHGKRIKLTLEHPAGGASTCAIDIPRWDFHWQQFYYYVDPLLGAPGDVLRLECTYDNATGTEPLTWGEATTDEMCLIYLYVTAP